MEENTITLAESDAFAAIATFPFLQYTVVLRPTNTPSPRRMPRFVEPFASSVERSSSTTPSPRKILEGCRSVTWRPITTPRPHAPKNGR